MERIIGGEQEGFLLSIRDDGNYLTVYPTDGDGGHVELSTLKQQLKNAGITNYDELQLAVLTRKSDGVEAKLDTVPLEEVEEEPRIPFTIDISRDQMTATIRFDQKQDGIAPTVSEIEEALAAKHIVYGIDTDAIHSGLDQLTSFVVAQGEPPQPGTDARIEKKFDMEGKGRPAARAFDRVDYKDMNIFIRAKIGDVLAVRIPQTKGVPGKNILGKEIAPKAGKPVPMPQGKNTKVINENELVAAIDGQVVEQGGKIIVDPHLLINSSVDVGTGNIDFSGSVEIKGDVESGFSVKATGDIEISGMIGGAEVEGRNIIVRGGIRGMNVGKIHALEDVTISFVENANLSAGRDIFVQDVILHSEVRAGHHVRVEGKRGIITGGVVGAGESIRAKVLGNDFYVQTILNVGIDPNLRHRYNIMLKEYHQSGKRLMEIRRSIAVLKKQDPATLAPRRKEQLMEMTREQFPLAGKIKRMREELRAIRAELAQMKNGSIAATDAIYPGVDVTINGKKRKIEDEHRHAKLQVVDGEVVVGVL